MRCQTARNVSYGSCYALGRWWPFLSPTRITVWPFVSSGYLNPPPTLPTHPLIHIITDIPALLKVSKNQHIQLTAMHAIILIAIALLQLQCKSYMATIKQKKVIMTRINISILYFWKSQIVLRQSVFTGPVTNTLYCSISNHARYELIPYLY